MMILIFFVWLDIKKVKIQQRRIARSRGNKDYYPSEKFHTFLFFLISLNVENFMLTLDQSEGSVQVT